MCLSLRVWIYCAQISYTMFDFSYSQFYDICEDLVQHKQYNVSLEPLIIYEEDEDENEGIVPFNEVDI